MAELAIGISKTAVEALVNKVKSAIKEEAEKWQTVERDIVFIKDEFEMMQSFLNTASGDRMKDQVARTWVRQVRDLSYDTEDCIDFVLHLNTNPSFLPRLHSILRRLQPSMVQKTLPLDKAVAEIKQLKARAEDVNQRNMRYNLIVGKSGDQVQQTTAASQMTLDILKKPTDAFDNQEDILDLNMLIKDEDKGLQVISVCGTGGDLGTISIINKTYDDQEICQMFEYRAWVKLVHPFNPHEFIRSMLAAFYSENSHKTGSATSEQTEADLGVQVLATMNATQDSIIKDFMEIVNKKAYLIVLEGLSDIVEWKAIRAFMPDMKNGSRIVVSTQQPEVASLCQTKNHGGNTQWDSVMMDEAELIIKKCGRLPKLSVALVKYLAEVRNGIREARRLNTNFMYALKTTKGLESFRDVFTWIYSNYQACPHLLKKCVFYLSLFTQSSMIRQSRLVRRWIAEGYSEGTDSNSIVEYTQNLLHELANLGITEHPQQTPTGAGNRSSCQINSFFLEYVISREMEENIFLALEVSILQGEGSVNTQRVGQHLTIGSSWKRDKFVFENMDFSRLRSLTVSREWRPFLISDRMRVLRVLDLEDTNVADGDIEQVVKLLPRLKFLGLRRCTKVSSLPESMGELRHLQTLDIRHTSVAKLPKSITRLQKLQYIRAATRVALMEENPSTPWRRSQGTVDACDGIMVPTGIGGLTALHTLGVLDISARGGKAILNELKNLTQLKKLGVSGIKRSNIKGLLPLSSAIDIWNHYHCSSTRTRIWTGWEKSPLQGTFGGLKSPNLHVKFAGPEMSDLEMLKVHCLHGSSLQLSGIDNQRNLKHVWMKGSFDDTVKEELRRKVGQHPEKPFCRLD
ncbi:hypothetical protein HU200_008403 [Digitaria exilis]|uniref:Uncharacterized protein n=1 Tax=Digitaria exilis TaxID=1010633 RepID=A0A835KRP8_9POAL|nr:hypothetical protein HU200_008403 [Digitaria exilis]